MQEVTIEVEMSKGTPPEAVQVDVTQGPHTLRTAQVDPANAVATFPMDEGDYSVRAQSLVPHGTPVESVFAVPVRITVRPAADHHQV